MQAHALDEQSLWNPSPARTFRGRDVYSPVAARLAAGLELERVGTRLDVDELERLAVRPPMVEADHVHGEVSQVDHFGNLTLNLSAAHLEQAGIRLGEQVELRVSGRSQVVPFLLTYGQVGRGRLAVCEDAFRTITVAVHSGSAAKGLRAGRGDPVVIARTAGPRTVERPVVLPPEPDLANRR